MCAAFRPYCTSYGNIEDVFFISVVVEHDVTKAAFIMEFLIESASSRDRRDTWLQSTLGAFPAYEETMLHGHVFRRIPC